jgi:hypothetical protein
VRWGPANKLFAILALLGAIALVEANYGFTGYFTDRQFAVRHAESGDVERLERVRTVVTGTIIVSVDHAAGSPRSMSLSTCEPPEQARADSRTGA